MKLIDNVKKVAYRTGKSLKKNAPTIMSVLACAGVIGTAVAAAKGHHAAMEALTYDHCDDCMYDTEEKKKRIVRDVKTAAPHYILPTVLGASTIALILGSNALNKKQQAALYGAFVALEQSYNRYREAVNKTFGEDADTKVKKEVAKDILKDGVAKHNSGDLTLFYEENSDQFFWSTMDRVKDAEYMLNRYFAGMDEASLNDWCECLGINKCEFGNVLGWNRWDGEAYYGYKWIDFTHEWHDIDEDEIALDEGEELDPVFDNTDTPGYYIIHTPFPPHTPCDPEDF